MTKYFLILLITIAPIFLYSQETSKPTDNNESPSSKEETQPNKKNSVELRLGVMHSDKGNHPGIGFLYERALTSNLSLGLSAAAISFTSEIRGGSLDILRNASGRLIPIDFVTSYYFMEGSSFRPYIRGYLGAAFLNITSDKGSYENTFTHAGLGVGCKYFFSEKIYASSEISANYFMGEDSARATNKTFAQLGIGYAF